MKNLYYCGTSRKVKCGDILTDFRNERYIAKYWGEPTHGEGKITVIKNADDFGREFYVSVFGLEWRDDYEDKIEVLKTIRSQHGTCRTEIEALDTAIKVLENS